jgi:ABC-type glycerol-3-phosphate transport system substrate-binding protein
MKTKTLWIGLAVVATLSACGGGSGAPPAAAPASAGDVPASATASPAAYTQFVKSLPSDETGQPLDVQAVTPPTSETDAPVSL